MKVQRGLGTCPTSQRKISDRNSIDISRLETWYWLAVHWWHAWCLCVSFILQQGFVSLRSSVVSSQKQMYRKRTKIELESQTTTESEAGVLGTFYFWSSVPWFGGGVAWPRGPGWVPLSWAWVLTSGSVLLTVTTSPTELQPQDTAPALARSNVGLPSALDGTKGTKTKGMSR